MESTLKSGQFDVKLSQEYKDKLEFIENSVIVSVQQGLKRKRATENNDENVQTKVVIIQEEEKRDTQEEEKRH